MNTSPTSRTIVHPSFDDVCTIVERSVADLFREDRILFEVDANERTITHTLAEKLLRYLNGWDVDCEYNRVYDGIEPKRMPRYPQNTTTDDEDAKTIFPDVIVHQRTGNTNLLVIEAKKMKNGIAVNEIDDHAKLTFLCGPPHNYEAGLLLRLSTGPGVRRSRKINASGDWYRAGNPPTVIMAGFSHEMKLDARQESRKA